MVKITVGPVIGKVTDTTARVLIEVDGDATVKCVATGPSGHTVEAQQSLKKDRFKAFELTGLKPSSVYNISFVEAAGPVTGTVRTFAAAPKKMNLGVVSCNFPVHIDEDDPWADLLNRYVKPGKLDMLLHLGDQIYGDSQFQSALSILGGATQGTPAQQEQIREQYRGIYRMNWQHPPTREVLARVPSLMIWDDHEIRDDWGSRKSDYDRSSAAYHVGTLARSVFREYQRQLWDDPVDPPSDGFEDHAHVWGKIGILFSDQRGGRTFGWDTERPYLGKPQWDRIESYFKKGGKFDDVRALIVATSVPLVYLGDGITNLGSHMADDLQDHWAFGKHRDEQVEMLRLLRNWKQKGNGDRELIVVGGDVHIGCETEIKHEEKTIFKQLITSPVTKDPPGWIQFQGLKFLLESEENLISGYSFEHSNYTRSNNYGIVLVRIPAAGELPKVSGGLQKV